MWHISTVSHHTKPPLTNADPSGSVELSRSMNAVNAFRRELVIFGLSAFWNLIQRGFVHFPQPPLVKFGEVQPQAHGFIGVDAPVGAAEGHLHQRQSVGHRDGWVLSHKGILYWRDRRMSKLNIIQLSGPSRTNTWKWCENKSQKKDIYLAYSPDIPILVPSAWVLSMTAPEKTLAARRRREDGARAHLATGGDRSEAGTKELKWSMVN